MSRKEATFQCQSQDFQALAEFLFDDCLEGKCVGDIDIQIFENAPGFENVSGVEYSDPTIVSGCSVRDACIFVNWRNIIIENDNGFLWEKEREAGRMMDIVVRSFEHKDKKGEVLYLADQEIRLMDNSMILRSSHDGIIEEVNVLEEDVEAFAAEILRRNGWEVDDGDS